MKIPNCHKPIEDDRIHQTIHSYKGSSNVYFCPNCGDKFIIDDYDK